jgi:hypothetical protein
MLAVALFVVGLVGQSAFAQVPVQLPLAPPDTVSTKIQFNLSEFNDDGLYGPPVSAAPAMSTSASGARHSPDSARCWRTSPGLTT